MPGRVRWGIGGGLLLFCGLSRAALASTGPDPSASSGSDALILLSYLLPAGLILLSVAALSEDHAVEAATGAVVAWGAAIVAYFLVGFAFQFGGIAVVNDAPDLAGLYWEYSLLDVSWGTGWGMIGLRGFLMSGDAATPGALTLFLGQLPLLGVATLILHFALWGRSRRWMVLPAALSMGAIIYPILGNWVWGGGWLANLGLNLSHGHGFVDAAGGGQAALVGVVAALAALMAFRPGPGAPAANSATTVEPGDGSDASSGLAVPMPGAHLPLLGWLGALLMTIGWMATSTLAYLPGADNVSTAVMAANLLLASFGCALAASLYSWFVSGRLDVLMAGRGVAAGLVLAAAGALFVPAWVALASGLAMGLLLPFLIFVFDRRLHLGDASALVAGFGVPSMLGLLLPGLLADGRFGIGWNRVGLESHLGVDGQGVAGLWTAPGMVPDWPGQMVAQLIGLVAIVAWSFGSAWVLLRIVCGVTRVQERRHLAFGLPSVSAPADDETAPGLAEATTADGVAVPSADPETVPPASVVEG